ncbi:MAG: acetate--CoA ligase family protein [Firmicutes bacterium]|nr:acetate--CoA ligase family protein [Bacillota bacterium]
MAGKIEEPGDSFRKMFYPDAIAVVGASSHPGKTGNFVLRSAVASGVGSIYPVNAGGMGEILGKKAYLSIEEIPDENVDLFLFAVPQQHILPGLESAIARGCRTAVIFTAGFREAGPEGERQQIALREMANEAGVKIIGPNTMGFFRSDSFINATFNPIYSQIFSSGGDISIVSQSGGVAGFIANQFIEHHLPLGTMVCLGNRANIDFADMLDFFAEDPITSVLALFIEGLDDLRHFYKAARHCATKKPVVVLSAGFTAAGRKIARSHTGSMVNSAVLYQAAFRQAGLLIVNSVQELVDTVKMIRLCPLPGGNRVALVTHTAGPAVLASDILEQGGLSLADLSDTTKKALTDGNVLPSFMPADNPVDLATFGYLERHRYISVIGTLLEDPNVDGTITVCMSSLGDDSIGSFPVDKFKEVIQHSGKPAAVIWAAPVSHTDEFKQWAQAGIPSYPTSERAATSYVNLVRYSEIKQRKDLRGSFTGFPDELKKYIKSLAEAGQDFVPEHQARQVVDLAGIKAARAILAKNEDEAVKSADEIGYPVALKVVARKIIHKSDVGGVVLNLKNSEEVRMAFSRIIRNVSAGSTDTGLQGISVQQMIPEGHEIIVGAVRDAEAGPVVMFGLGGIWVEAIKDVTFRLAPVTPEEAREMIQEIKGYKILQGYRGKGAVDTGALADLIVKTGHLVDQFPIKEIELNPVIFYNHSNYAVADARIILID